MSYKKKEEGCPKRGTKSVEVVLSLKLEVLAILKGGAIRFHPSKRVPQKDLPFL